MLAEFQTDKVTEIAEEGPSTTEVEVLALDMEAGSSVAELAGILPESEVNTHPESGVDTPLALDSLTDMASVPTITSENSYDQSFAQTINTPPQFSINRLVQIH